MIDGEVAADLCMHSSVSRSGPELILATKPFVADNTIRSWWYILSTAVLLVVAVAATLLAPHVLLKLGASVLSGLLLLRMFVIYHDQQHHAILPKSKAAERFMWVFGIISLSPSSIWRSSHNHHHNHNSKIKGSHIGSFPIMTREHFEKASKSARWLYLFTRHPLTILFGYLTVFFHGMCLRPFVMKPREHWDCFVSLFVHIVIAGCLIAFGGWQAWLLTQVIPHAVASGIGSYLFYAQHNFPTVAFYDKSGWTYDRAALESSSFMKMGPLMAWFSANIGYHHVHHLNSRIPFYRLPEVQKAIPELQNPKVTSLNPIDIYRCLRLKVWDVKQQKMVGLED